MWAAKMPLTKGQKNEEQEMFSMKPQIAYQFTAGTRSPLPRICTLSADNNILTCKPNGISYEPITFFTTFFHLHRR